MARYIDADRLEKEMYHEAFETDTDMQKWDSGCWIRYKMFENCIAQQPTADVVEVVHGEWSHLGGDEWCCTNCGEVIHTEGSWEKPEKKFCHECGAKMDGKKVE